MNSNDLRALTLIQEGKLTANPTTGDVHYKGKLATVRSHGYIKVAGIMAHRAVWLAEHGFIEDVHEINHRNRKRDDNRLINLESVTRSQNVRHAYGHIGYAGVRPEDVANASPEFIADLAQRLGIDYTDDPDLMAWALQRADSASVEPPEREPLPDDVLKYAPDGNWVTRYVNGVMDARVSLSRTA